MNLVPALRLVTTLAVRNLLAHKMKSLIVGALLAFGTFLVVTGSAMLSSVESAMEGSITNSLTGQLQVYSSEAKDPLALFGGMNMSSPDVGEVADFGAVDALLSDVENVSAVVPMGISFATVFGRNEIDVILNDLRDAVDIADESTQRLLIDRVKSIVHSIQNESASLAKIVADVDEWNETGVVMDRVASEDYFTTFQADPLGEVHAMENYVAPAAKDGRLLYFRTLGTDLEQFGEVFDRFYIVDGEPIPPGKRGYLFSKRTYEEFVKHKVARELDSIYQAVTEDGKTIATDTLLQEQVERNARQYQRIVFHLDAAEAATLETKLHEMMPEVDADLAGLVQAFLQFDDASLVQRYAFFYDVIGPMVPVYEVPVGSEITLRSFTKSGYMRAVNVPVYGTFHFRGLEDSDLSGATNLTDLVTFRDLYGKMSDAQRAELDSIRDEVGVQDVDRADAEDMLFGGGGLFDESQEEVAVEAAAPEGLVGPDGWGGAELEIERSTATETFDNAEARSGLVLNAAVLLDDPSRASDTKRAIESAIAASGLSLQVVDWQEASGLIGQFVVVVRVVLVIALFVIFLVALVIINNSMVMATLDRTPEIGTMRAIGAQRKQVVALFMAETLLLGLIAGGVGICSSMAFVGWLGEVGVPAVQDVLVVLFSGPRLYPGYGGEDLALGLVSVLSVSLLSTLYPAALASRVEPVVAMQGKE